MSCCPSCAELFDRLYVEQPLVRSPFLEPALRRLAGLEPVFVPGKEGIPAEHRNPRTLFLSGPRGRVVTRCPGSPGQLCCNYFTVDLYLGCALGCAYCILRSYLNFAPLTVYLDPGPAAERLKRLARANPDRLVRAGTGELGDSLLLDPLFGLSESLIRALAPYPNVRLELKTKTANVDHLLGIEDKGGAVIAFSLNPPELIRAYEGRSSPLPERLEAARRAAQAGFRVSFHFDPIIAGPRAEEEYRAVARLLADFPPGSVAWISLGTFRYPPELRERVGCRELLHEEFVPCPDGKHRYPQPARSRLYRALKEELSRVSDAPIYLCMESPAVWRNVFGRLPREMPELRAIFSPMKTKGTALLAGALAAAGLLPAAAQSQERIGELAYLEGELAVTRNNRSLSPEEVDIGLEVQNLDLLKTGRNGFAELAVEAPRLPATVIKVSPNTTFYLELNSLGRERRATVGAITGTVALKVQKLGANQRVDVSTESAVMGVRGTAFEVTLTPSGDLLVSCSEGQVLCQDEEGRELAAGPGEAVEQPAGEPFQKVPVAVSDLQQFRRNWYARRLEVFKANPLKAMRFYALRYRALRERFLQAYAGLQREKAILQKWYQEDRQGKLGGRVEMLREKKRLIGYILRLRRILFLFERLYFRLEELQDYYRQGYGQGTLEGSLTSRAFFESFDRDRQELARRMAEVRYVIKLYAKRNEGAFPTDRGEEGESELFGAEPD
jgi:spore photoproduct lyase